MPSILSDGDHHSLSSLSGPVVPSQTPPSSPAPPQQHHHRFPSHSHPSYHSQFQHLPPPEQPRTRPPPRRPSSASSAKPPGARFGVPATNTSSSYSIKRSGTTSRSTRTSKNERAFLPTSKRAAITSNKFQQHFYHGPKWIHRQGLVNGINYHWVETTATSEDEDNNVKLTDKPLVILLHGFPQFWYAWRHQIVPLGDAGYRVVVPDLRGFNLTDKPLAPKRKAAPNNRIAATTPALISTSTATATAAAGKNSHSGCSKHKDDRWDTEETKEQEATYDTETLTSDIRALMLHLGHEEAHIVGHDWGGIIAWAFAARFPQHTAKLVVMNAPHLCRWRDVEMDYSSASCVEQAWWTGWYTVCCQLLPSWIAEAVLSYDRSWLLTYNMPPTRSFPNPLSCLASATSVTDSSNFVCTESNNPNRPDGFAALGGGGCASCWKPTDLDLYRDSISKPGAIYALLEYYRNLWLSIQQMEQYGKIQRDLPILVLWGLKDKTFPKETYCRGWEDWIEHDPCKTGSNQCPSVTVSYLDCGHFTPEEAPAEVNEQLLNFLGQSSAIAWR